MSQGSDIPYCRRADEVLYISHKLEVSLEDAHLRSTVSGLLDLLLWIGELPQSHKPGHQS
jgi:hypothetical protein